MVDKERICAILKSAVDEATIDLESLGANKKSYILNKNESHFDYLKAKKLGSLVMAIEIKRRVEEEELK